MNGLSRPIGRPLIAIMAMAYVTLLAAMLILWHQSPVLVLALTLGGIGLVTIALRPYWGLHVFIMILFVEDVGGEAQGFTVMKAVGILIIWGWLSSTAIRRKSTIGINRVMVLTLVFLAWCGITLIYAIDAQAAISRLFSFTQLALTSIMFASVVDTPERLRGVLTAIVAWGFVATSVALTWYYLGLTRVAMGLVGNRNLLATYIVVSVVCAYLLHQATRHKGARILLALCLPVFFLGLGLTFSRTGIIIQALTLVLVGYRVVKEKGFLLLAGSTAALCVITLLLPSGFYRRVSTIVPAIEQQRDTYGTRVRLWKVGLRMIEDRPVVGVGPGNFVVAGPRYNRGQPYLNGLTAHNTYVSVGAEVGLVGLGLFVALLLAGLHQARLAIRSAKIAGIKDVEMLAIACEISLFVLILGGMSGTVEGLKLLWILLGVSAGLSRMLPSRRGARPAAREALEGRAASWTLAPGGTS